MMNLFAATGLALALTTTAAFAQDSDRVDHYAPVESANFAEAVANFNDYNRRMVEVLETDELTRDQMEQIHQLTYTIEDALAMITETMTNLAPALERVHLSSEGDNPQELRANAEAYLETALELGQ